MAEFFEDSKPFGTLDSHVAGGRSVVLDELPELDALIALCSESRALGLDHLYEWLPRFEEWLSWWAEDEAPRMRNSDFGPDELLWKHPHNLTHIEGLEVSLRLAREVWGESPDREDLAFLVSVVDPKRLGELIYEGPAPALFLCQGSIRAMITPFREAGRFVLQLGAFGVGLCLKMQLPTVQAQELVKELRTRARGIARYPDIPSLGDVKGSDVKGKRGLIVLLHGLFSTDLATFDGFFDAWPRPPQWSTRDVYRLQSEWRELRNEPSHSTAPGERDYKAALSACVEHDYLVAGWPHDTFSSIDANAIDLAKVLVELDPGMPVAFVCHSRGGLLGRKTAQILLNRKAADWTDRIKSCITFGTPHEGAELAEHPLTYAASYLLVMAGTRSAVSLARVLSVYRGRGQFEGIEDLRPDGAFLDGLKASEIGSGPIGKANALRVQAVGGQIQRRRPIPRTFVTALLGTRDHDLVVRSASSAPSWYTRWVTDCGHDEYFSETETKQDHFLEVVQELRTALGVEQAMLMRAETSGYSW